MIRQIMALFDEYQSKENAKHTLRAMKENARQGFWNGALPPIGYRIVEAAEQRGHRTKKTLESDPIQTETVRLIFSLAREEEEDGSSGLMGVKSDAAQEPESGAHRAARRQKPDAPYRHLLLRRMRRREDAEDREEREIQVLHLLHLGPAG
ncbi:hypothetical protein [Bradyrhizobium sp. 139]|uniref:hypothetical protein n=1 Tax=Bradyrhizobium sp. 139 TaxID=2782616 RepID=UPI001FF8F517|nr:hypothetical protein [Bradyrhizobium sp. 139]